MQTRGSGLILLLRTMKEKSQPKQLLGRSTAERYALLLNALPWLSREECALSMEQRVNTNDAAVMDAQNKPSKEECASSMGQRSNDAAVKDASIKLLKEECALDMVQRLNTNDAAKRDAQISERGVMH